MDLLNKLWSKLNSWPHWVEMRRIVLAISGGVDSMVLLDSMMRINERLPKEDKKELVVVHFNHHLRPESNQDLIVIKEYLASFEGIYLFGHWENPSQTNIEAEAREARYAFFADAIQGTDSEGLMTAHHLDDGVETVLIRLIRGSSIKGMSGIDSDYQRLLQTSNKHTISVRLMRPMINITKEEIYQYAEEHKVPYIEDQSNYQDIYLRNRVRNTILPLLEAENPQFMRNLMLLSEQFASSYKAHYQAYLQIEPRFASMISQERWLLYIPELRELSLEQLQIYILIFFEERLVYQLPNYNKAVLKQLEYMILQNNSPNMVIDLGNHWQAVRIYDYIRIGPIEDKVTYDTKLDSMQISEMNTWYALSKEEYIGVFTVEALNKLDLKFDSMQIISLNINEFNYINIRHRQPGDLIHLQRNSSENYHKKVARILIDKKVPANVRENFWIVENDDLRVLAMLPHIANDDYYFPKDKQERFVLLYKNFSPNLESYANIIKYNKLKR